MQEAGRVQIRRKGLSARFLIRNKAQSPRILAQVAQFISHWKTVSDGSALDRSGSDGIIQHVSLDDITPPNPSTIHVMVGSPSKKQMRVRDLLQSFGNLFQVRLVIYHEFERV